MAKITTIRFTDEEWSIIEKEVGNTSMSKYIKDKLFIGPADPLSHFKDEGYKKFLIQVLKETDLFDLTERLIIKARAVKQFNSEDPIEYGKAIAKCSAVLAGTAEIDEKNSPEGWKIQQTPNGDKFPYYSDDLNKLILVLEKEGQRPITIDENHDWWKHFTI